LTVEVLNKRPMAEEDSSREFNCQAGTMGEFAVLRAAPSERGGPRSNNRLLTEGFHINLYEVGRYIMKQFCNQDALFASWRRCAQAGLSPDAIDKLYPLETEKIQLLCRDYQAEITSFRHITSSLPLPGDTASVLMDARGILLEKKCKHRGMETVLSGPFLCRGMCRGKRCFPRALAV